MTLLAQTVPSVILTAQNVEDESEVRGGDMPEARDGVDSRPAPSDAGRRARESDSGRYRGISGQTVQRQVFGNTPDDVTSQLVESEESIDSLLPRGLLDQWHESWQTANRRMRRVYGLDLGFNETILFQSASTGLHPRSAASDDIDIFGEWIPGADGDGSTGFLTFSTEIRNRYTTLTPSQLSGNIGSEYATTAGFNSKDFALVQLYWEQGSIGSGLRFRAGRMDPGLIYDGGRYVSSNYAFLSPAFSDTPAMALPEQGLGIAAAVYPTENAYLLVGIHDANGRRNTSGFRSFFEEGEFFTGVEFGVFPSQDDAVHGLWHFTFWHVDARKRQQIRSDHGFALTVEQELGADGQFVPWLRYSYADSGLNPIRQNLAGGVGLENVLGQNQDVIGIGLGWGVPADRSLRSEYVLELFYRIVVTPHTHITPDLQVIIDPASAPDRSSVSVFGLRLRTLF